MRKYLKSLKLKWSDIPFALVCVSIVLAGYYYRNRKHDTKFTEAFKAALRQIPCPANQFYECHFEGRDGRFYILHVTDKTALQNKDSLRKETEKKRGRIIQRVIQA